jgi:hypothetical protein
MPVAATCTAVGTGASRAARTLADASGVMVAATVVYRPASSRQRSSSDSGSAASRFLAPLATTESIGKAG